MNQAKKLTSLTFGVGLGWAVCASVANAAPGDLSDKPLFLSTNVQPNILMLLDDSGSMDWEVLKSRGAEDAYSWGRNSGSVDITPTDGDASELLESCPGYNVMFYDPTKTYTPWVGVDSNGDAYTDQSLTTAAENPFNSGGTTRDLTVADGGGHYPGYIPWDDADTDGEFDVGECGDTQGADEAGTTVDYSRFVNAKDMSAVEQTNFANWYSYYRKREYVMKRAVSQIIDRSKARMGLATLHNHGSYATPIQDIDTFTPDPSTTAYTTALGYKNTLMEHLFEVYSDDGTPLRQTLEEAGKYFDVDQTTSLFDTSPSSPILPDGSGGQCQQNFSVMLSDGYWNGGDPSVGDEDGDDDTDYDGGSYADSYSNTLADVAMAYYEGDLAPLIPNNVPAYQAAFDDNPAQHMVTYTVAFGVNGTLSSSPTDPTQSFTWPEPVADTETSIDDMRHAAWNGRGLFLNAGDPEELINSLSASIQSIGERQGSASSVSFNSTSITSDTKVFQARFDTDGWSGSIQAFAFDATNGAGALQWDAGILLRNRDLSTTPRQIITSGGLYDGDTSTDGSTDATRGIVFDFPADYDSPDSTTEIAQSQINDLMYNAPYTVGSEADSTEIGINQRYGETIVSYFRGDQTCESICTSASDSWQFRSRSQDINGTLVHNKLGDIVHSSPQFVGIPNVNYPDLIEGSGNEYSDFVSSQATRDPMVYVGANDGMVHGFNADSGQEVFAYVPFAMFSDQDKNGLHYLAQQDYAHIPYVDGSPFATDVFINSAWRTYLVGGYRAGGKGVYVLDVTNPTSLNEASAGSVVKLEFTHSDLGYTFSRPLIGKMNNGKWAAVFGNGYNSTGDGRAKLFILYLDGTGYKVIDTEQGSIVSSDCADASSDCNGLSSPTILDITGDAIIDRAYAGDLHGNLWVFDLTDSDPNGWGVAYDNGALPPVPTPLFQGCTSATSPCPAASRQPITSRPAVTSHPEQLSSATDPNLMVYFGTGQYVANGDESTTFTQSMYGIWDAGASNDDLRRSDLEEQTISSTSTTINGNPVTLRDLTTEAVNYNPGASPAEFGWYIDLPVSKERIVVDPLVSGSIVFFNTIIPNTALCDQGGSGFIMFADRLSGGRPAFPVTDLNNDGTLDSNDLGAGGSVGSLLSGSRIIDGILATSTSRGDILDSGIVSTHARKSKRSSWSHAR